MNEQLHLCSFEVWGYFLSIQKIGVAKINYIKTLIALGYILSIIFQISYTVLYTVLFIIYEYINFLCPLNSN